MGDRLIDFDRLVWSPDDYRVEAGTLWRIRRAWDGAKRRGSVPVIPVYAIDNGTGWVMFRNARGYEIGSVSLGRGKSWIAETTRLGCSAVKVHRRWADAIRWVISVGAIDVRAMALPSWPVRAAAPPWVGNVEKAALQAAAMDGYRA